VVVDEAYVDFGGETCIPLIKRYDNLLVVQTFSKSRSMAGARLGFAAGDAALINDLNAMKFSINPYNINSMTMSLGLGALADRNYFLANCRTIIKNRDYTVTELMKLGFKVLDSKANFIFASHPSIGGKELYLALKERGVLVRYFDKDRIREYVRISIGKKEQMDVLLEKVQEILAK
jgi:histidinol-phosphate aminotransferase